MFANGQTVVQLMEKWVPKRLAVPDDKIGLQLGTLQKPIRHVLVALDVTDDVVEEAIASGTDLIIAHHAVIFRPLTHLCTDTQAGKRLAKLLKHDIAVYISHTNLDVADGGVNDLLAEALGLQSCVPLEVNHTETLLKLTVFVPLAEADAVREAMFQAGAGVISETSNYSHCSFNIKGTGTFLPLDGAKPTIGQVGKPEAVEEIRVELIVSETKLKPVLQAMRKSHPYEEVAYDLYELQNEGRKQGLGRVGRLPQPETLEQFAARVKRAFSLDGLRVTGKLDSRIVKVAVLGGSGGRYVRHALFHGADVLVTGDLDHHTALDALADGICLVDAGHHIEAILKPAVATQLQSSLVAAGYSTTVSASTVSSNPFRFI